MNDHKYRVSVNWELFTFDYLEVHPHRHINIAPFIEKTATEVQLFDKEGKFLNWFANCSDFEIKYGFNEDDI